MKKPIIRRNRTYFYSYYHTITTVNNWKCQHINHIETIDNEHFQTIYTTYLLKLTNNAFKFVSFDVCQQCYKFGYYGTKSWNKLFDDVIIIIVKGLDGNKCRGPLCRFVVHYYKIKREI